MERIALSPQLNMALWPVEKPRAVVQILHGMAEHIARYDGAAKALNAAGYAVAGHDHRGHGPDCPKDALGMFDKQTGWDGLIEDAAAVTSYLKQQYPGVPLVLLGHSMGSFAAREYALRYGQNINALVLSGTGLYPVSLVKAGRLLARLSPPDKPAKLVNRVTSMGNNKHFSPPRTEFDWLTRDEKEVDKYIADDRCGFLFTGRTYAAFFGGLYNLTKPDRLNALPKTLPVYLFSGDKDPIGQNGEGVRAVAQQYKEAGLTDVTLKLYPDGRHEMFNELNRDEVLEDLVHWLEGRFYEQ